MRSFIVAAIILSLIIVIVIVNSVYVISKIDLLSNLCENLNENSSAESVHELVTKWQSCCAIIALSVHKSEIERVENAIHALYNFRERPDEFNYQLAVLKEALNSIANNQKLSLDGII